MTTRDEALRFAKQLKGAGVNMSAYEDFEGESDMFIKASFMINELAELLPKEKIEEGKRELPPKPPIESKGEEEKKGISPSACARARAFANAFWSAYPVGRKYDKKHCQKSLRQRYYEAKDPEAFAKLVLDGLEKWKACERWMQGFIVLPKTFISQERWNDEPPPPDPKLRATHGVSQTANTHANGERAW